MTLRVGEYISKTLSITEVVFKGDIYLKINLESVIDPIIKRVPI